MDSRDLSGLEGYAVWVSGEKLCDRLWSERLAANAAELEVVRGLGPCEFPAYVAQSTRIEGARGDAQKIARARNSSDSQACEEAPADVARRAREANSRLKAFSFIADPPEAARGGYLDGMAFAVKDMIAVAGMPLTAGSASQDTTPAKEDAACVLALKSQGAVAIGMANQHELAFGATSNNPVYGQVVNPAAPAYMPGGSSGGSAACVAAGLVRFALGTDTGGSVRLPAACCGVVGFKPTYDAISREGAIEVAASLDHIGPIGQKVADCALAFAGMLGLPDMPVWRMSSLENIKIGRLGGFFEDPIDAEVLTALEQAAKSLAAAGGQVLPAAFEEARKAAALYFVTALGEASEAHSERLQLNAKRLGRDVRSRLETGHFIPAHWYIKAQRHRASVAHAANALFERFDILLSATMRAPAAPVGTQKIDIGGTSYPLHAAMTELTIPFSLTGAPALSLPWGQTRAGVPIALQLAAKPGEDWKLLAVAEQLESISPEKTDQKQGLQT